MCVEGARGSGGCSQAVTESCESRVLVKLNDFRKILVKLNGFSKRTIDKGNNN